MWLLGRKRRSVRCLGISVHNAYNNRLQESISNRSNKTATNIFRVKWIVNRFLIFFLISSNKGFSLRLELCKLNNLD